MSFLPREVEEKEGGSKEEEQQAPGSWLRPASSVSSTR